MTCQTGAKNQLKSENSASAKRKPVGLASPINKLLLLKTAAFVLNFKLWPPKSTALAPALGENDITFSETKSLNVPARCRTAYCLEST